MHFSVSHFNLRYMFMIARTVTVVLFALLVLAGSASAASTVAFEGFVKDAKGQPIKGAELHITGKDGKMISKNKTDANGHYVSSALAFGTYKVDLFINSALKATLADAKMKPTGATELNFDLRDASKKRRIWVKETGTNIGRWVEVDENGKASASDLPNNSQMSKETLQRIQANQTNNSGSHP